MTTLLAGLCVALIAIAVVVGLEVFWRGRETKTDDENCSTVERGGGNGRWLEGGE